MPNKTALLKSLIERLQNGESLESVRRDFAENFSSVNAEEIAQVEQQLINAGTPVAEVQRLCDVHAALNPLAAEIDVEALQDGHPAKTLHAENIALQKFLDELNEKFAANDAENFCREFPKLNAIHSHYGKKEFLFMPILSNHGVTGPSQVMWGVDDEIKKQVRTLAKNLSPENFSDRAAKLQEVLQSIREMIFKEENIFIPLTFKFFSDEEFLNVYRDLLEMQPAFITEIPRWQAGDRKLSDKKFSAAALDTNKIIFPTGELTLAQLQGIFKLLPVDITFIDKDDIIRFFVNEGKIFDRPLLALGNDIYSCHPPKVLPMIRQMLNDFKAKKRTSLEIWRMIKGKPVSVGYFAVYDESGDYVGAVEFVRDFTQALKKF